MNTRGRRLLLAARIAMCSLVAFGGALNSPAQVNPAVFRGGERLQYKVKWLFFRLGTIVVTTEALANDSSRFRVLLTLDSSPGLFFISLHNRYEGIVSVSPLRSEGLEARESAGDDTLVTTYTFDKSAHRILMEQRIVPPDTVLKSAVKDSLDIFFDGPSLFFLARAMLHNDTTITVPTMVDLDLFSTDITFTDNVTPISVGALEDEVRTRTFHGRANFQGKTFGGFSGNFSGWFSNDSAAVPIRAEMEITLGSVVLELEQWSRLAWTPPLIQE